MDTSRFTYSRASDDSRENADAVLLPRHLVVSSDCSLRDLRRIFLYRNTRFNNLFHHSAMEPGPTLFVRRQHSDSQLIGTVPNLEQPQSDGNVVDQRIDARIVLVGRPTGQLSGFRILPKTLDWIRRRRPKFERFAHCHVLYGLSRRCASFHLDLVQRTFEENIETPIRSDA